MKYRIEYIPPTPNVKREFDYALVIYHPRGHGGPTPSSCAMMVRPYMCWDADIG